TNASGAGATQTLNSLAIDSSTGFITAAAALSNSSSTWLIAEDTAGNLFAQMLILALGTSAANSISVPQATTATFGLGGNDTITGTSGNDAIAAGAGNDTIVGLVGLDVVNGGSGTDTIQLAATSASLNAATDAQIVNVENISAASASAGVTIDLHNQSEGFTIAGRI